MSGSPKLTLDDVMELKRGNMFRYEEAQQAYVLLFPEGMARMENPSSAEIMKRVDGKNSIADIVRELEQQFDVTGIAGDVLDFLEIARGKSWIVVR